MDKPTMVYVNKDEEFGDILLSHGIDKSLIPFISSLQIDNKYSNFNITISHEKNKGLNNTPIETIKESLINICQVYFEISGVYFNEKHCYTTLTLIQTDNKSVSNLLIKLCQSVKSSGYYIIDLDFKKNSKKLNKIYTRDYAYFINEISCPKVIYFYYSDTENDNITSIFPILFSLLFDIKKGYTLDKYKVNNINNFKEINADSVCIVCKNLEFYMYIYLIKSLVNILRENYNLWVTEDELKSYILHDLNTTY